MRKLTENKLVLASHNTGKLAEITNLLNPFEKSVISAGQLGLQAPKETENTFEGNARIKAHFTAQAAGLPALSDDSGLEIKALENAPGVYSADWAETPKGRDFQKAMQKVWECLTKTKRPPPYKARFVCTLCLAWPDGHDEVVQGEVNGIIVWPARGTQGFGYDPMFQPDGLDKTFGEIPPEEKHAISHRTEAFKQLVAGCLRA